MKQIQTPISWTAQLIRHRGETRIAVYFNHNQELITRIKKLEGVKWSATKRVWHLPDTDAYRQQFKLEPRFILNDEHANKIEEFKIWMRTKRLSESTVKTYADALKAFLTFYNNTPIHEISNQDIIKFNNEFILHNKLSASYQNQIVNAIKKFFQIIELKKLNVDLIHRPKRAKLLPNVLSKDEVKSILNAHSNLKHRTMLSLIYSCGLRRGELLNLKPVDIDSKRNIILIKQAKGKKDRIVPLSPKVLAMLREYFKYFKPKTWLFEGQHPNTQYDERSLASVLKYALQKCGIQKPVTLHWLRHSYATHLLESGTDLRYIQEILGHRSSKTTEIYTHVSTRSLQQIKSPFDDLDL